MKKTRALIVLVGIFSIFFVSCSSGNDQDFAESNPMPGMTETNPTQSVIIIDAGAEKQTIESFGAAGAWWAQDVGGWEDEKRALIADLLFSQERGIGLSIYRYNIGGGNGENIQDVWRRAETFELAPGVYDWNQDANAVWMLRAARDRGVANFVAFVNSPPARMTISGLTTGEVDGLSNLSPEMYSEFSQYLADVVHHLRNDEGIPIQWISPLNEPQWNWSYKNGQEGCHYGPEQVLNLTRTLLRVLEENDLPVQLSMFESGEWKSSDVYVEALASDPEVWSSLPHLSIHSYWSTRADKIRFMNYLSHNHPDKTLWMSEWTEMMEGRDTGMDSALVLASTIHDDLTIANVTSWQYWIAVSKYQYRDGLIYVDTLDHDIVETKRLWALGNFSRYIRPGYIRMETSGGGDSLLVSAFRSPDNRQWAIVAINLSNQPVSLRLEGVHGILPEQASQYETSEEYSLVPVSQHSTQEPWMLAPLSVTTLVLDR